MTHQFQSRPARLGRELNDTDLAHFHGGVRDGCIPRFPWEDRFKPWPPVHVE